MTRMHSKKLARGIDGDLVMCVGGVSRGASGGGAGAHDANLNPNTTIDAPNAAPPAPAAM